MLCWLTQRGNVYTHGRIWDTPKYCHVFEAPLTLWLLKYTNTFNKTFFKNQKSYDSIYSYLPSQSAIQFRFLLCKNLTCPGCSYDRQRVWTTMNNHRGSTSKQILDRCKWWFTCLILFIRLFFFMSSSLEGIWCRPLPISSKAKDMF